jgi:HAD superfamily hydrolase (TIGR01509 family)
MAITQPAKEYITLKAIILDFDGLILDTETPLYLSWQEVCAAHGVPMDHSWWATRLTAHSDPPEAYALLEERSSIALDRDRLRKARTTREFQLIEEQAVLPGVVDLISQAKALSLQIGIASNSERAWVTGHLSRLGLLREFDQIKCRDEVPNPKPSPDLYLAVLEALGVSPQQAVAFEDSPVGVAAARAAGVFCVAVPNSVTRGLDFPAADLIIPSLDGICLANLISIT